MSVLIFKAVNNISSPQNKKISIILIFSSAFTYLIPVILFIVLI